VTAEFILGWTVKASWLVFIAYWIIAARDVKPTRWRESRIERVADGALLLIAAFLLAVRPLLPGFLLARFAASSLGLDALGAVLTLAGVLFAVWARRHLGRNWSGDVTVKDEHALVRSGPYAFLRHPIYSGVLLALLGTALSFGEWRGLAALLLFVIAVLRRIGAEETQMRRTFPGYDRYRSESWALVPLIY
jgi:protein-S-isoprenylcysteine O-methyltransferase Ste14